MVKMVRGKEIKEVNYGSMRWYKEAGWVVYKPIKEKKDETNSKKNARSQRKV